MGDSFVGIVICMVMIFRRWKKDNHIGVLALPHTLPLQPMKLLGIVLTNAPNDLVVT
jgi:hypothetical protein